MFRFLTFYAPNVGACSAFQTRREAYSAPQYPVAVFFWGRSGGVMKTQWNWGKGNGE